MSQFFKDKWGEEELNLAYKATAGTSRNIQALLKRSQEMIEKWNVLNIGYILNETDTDVHMYTWRRNIMLNFYTIFWNMNSITWRLNFLLNIHVACLVNLWKMFLIKEVCI